MRQTRTLEEHQNRDWGTSGRRVRIGQMTDKHLLNLRDYLEKRLLTAQILFGEARTQAQESSTQAKVQRVLSTNRDVELFEGWIDSVQAEMDHRGLTRGKFPRGPSPMTTDEKRYIQIRTVRSAVEEVILAGEWKIMHQFLAHVSIMIITKNIQKLRNRWNKCQP